MTPLDIAVWHLTGALRNVQLHRRAFCHAARYPRRGRWVDGTRWPDLEGCAKCQRTLRRVSYAWAFAAALCKSAEEAWPAWHLGCPARHPETWAPCCRTPANRPHITAGGYAWDDQPTSGRFHVDHPKLTQEPRPWAQDLLRTAPGRMTPYAREWLAGVAEAEGRQGSPDAGQALPPESPR